MANKYNGTPLLISTSSRIGKVGQQVVGMAKEAVLAGELDRLGNAGVIAPCQDPRRWNILLEQISRPTNVLGAPGTERIAAEAVDEYYTIQGSVRSPW